MADSALVEEAPPSYSDILATQPPPYGNTATSPTTNTPEPQGVSPPRAQGHSPSSREQTYSSPQPQSGGYTDDPVTRPNGNMFFFVGWQNDAGPHRDRVAQPPLRLQQYTYHTEHVTFQQLQQNVTISEQNNVPNGDHVTQPTPQQSGGSGDGHYITPPIINPGNQGAANNEQKPRNYLGLSILTTIFCFCGLFGLFGFIAIGYGLKVDYHWRRGEIRQAKSSSCNVLANNLTAAITGFGFGVGIIILVSVLND